MSTSLVKLSLDTPPFCLGKNQCISIKRGWWKDSDHGPSYLLSTGAPTVSRFHVTGTQHCHTKPQWPAPYEVRDLFPWEMLTKTVISSFVNVEKNLKLDTNKPRLDIRLLPKILLRHNNIHREIDQWNRRRFGAKWNVTVPNSVTLIKPILCKWIYMLQWWYCQMTHKLHVY